MTRTAFFLAGFALASFAPSIVGDRTPRAESGLAARVDDKAEDKQEAAARKRKKVEELQVAMNQKGVTTRMMEASMETFTEMGLPESFQACFKDNFDVDEVIGFTVDIWAEHLEESTVDALIAFYKSDEGQAFTKVLPEISVEAFKKGSEYGKRVGIACAEER